MEQLKKLLGDDLFATVVAKLGDTKIIVDDGKLIPKARFDEVNTKKSELEKQVTALQTSETKLKTDYDALKAEKESGTKTVEDQLKAVTEKLTAFENQIKEKDTQLVTAQKRAIVESHLRAAKANEAYLPTLTREFELKHPLDKLEIVDGKIKDADTILKPFQESFKPMFGEFVAEGYNPNLGEGHVQTPDYSKMTDPEYFAARLAEQKK